MTGRLPKAHIGVDADSGLVHTVTGTSGNVAEVVEGNSLLQGEETDAFSDAGYQGVHKRPDAKKDVTWYVAMRAGKRKELDKENNRVDALIDQMEKIKATAEELLALGAFRSGCSCADARQAKGSELRGLPEGAQRQLPGTARENGRPG